MAERNAAVAELNQCKTGQARINELLAQDTKKIEKGVSEFEAKYDKLRKQYKELQTSCDQDLASFQADLQEVRKISCSDELAASKCRITELEMEVKESVKKYEECHKGQGSNQSLNTSDLAASDLGKNSSDTGLSSDIASSGGLNASKGSETIYETDYTYGKGRNIGKTLTIAEVRENTMSCLTHMDSTIEGLKTDRSIDKTEKSAMYFEECETDIQLLHEIMGDWGQKTIAFDGPKTAAGRRKQQQMCV